MSAYLVTEEHINYLVDSAKKIGERGRNSGFSWFHEGEHKKLMTEDDQTEAGQMLWNANQESMGARYKEEFPAPLYRHKPGRFDLEVDRIQVIKACHCFEYQACEYEGYYTSEAHGFIMGLIKAACQSMRGYDDAEWGPPLTETQRRDDQRAKVVRWLGAN